MIALDQLQRLVALIALELDIREAAQADPLEESETGVHDLWIRNGHVIATDSESRRILTDLCLDRVHERLAVSVDVAQVREEGAVGTGDDLGHNCGDFDPREDFPMPQELGIVVGNQELEPQSEMLLQKMRVTRLQTAREPD